MKVEVEVQRTSVRTYTFEVDVPDDATAEQVEEKAIALASDFDFSRATECESDYLIASIDGPNYLIDLNNVIDAVRRESRDFISSQHGLGFLMAAYMSINPHITIEEFPYEELRKFSERSLRLAFYGIPQPISLAEGVARGVYSWNNSTYKVEEREGTLWIV